MYNVTLWRVRATIVVVENQLSSRVRLKPDGTR